MLKNSKKLVVAIVVLVLTIALATTATFAWFTMNQKVTLGQIDLDVTTETDGLFISTTKADFGAAIDASNTEVIAAMTNVKLLDVSGKSTASTETGKTGLYTLNFTDISGTAISYDSNAKQYLKLKVYFRGTDAYDIVLTGDSTVNPNTKDGDKLPEVAYWKTTEKDLSDFAGLYGHAAPTGPDYLLSTRAAYATRVAFQAVNSGDDKATVQPQATIWNPYKGDTTVSYGGGTSNLARDYRNELLGLTGSNKLNYSEEAGSSTADLADQSLIKLVKDGGFYTGEMDIYIYIEGTDGDCFNAILSDHISVNLTFAIKETI